MTSAAFRRRARWSGLICGVFFGVGLPGLCAAQVVLPSPNPPASRTLPDPPGVQWVRMPDGSSLKRWPGDASLPTAPAAPSARASTAAVPSGLKLVQNGNVLALADREDAAGAPAAAALPLAVRQVGSSRVLELRGLPAVDAAPDSTAQVAPRGLRVVELSTGAALPLFPEPNTLYRRLRD